MFQRWARLSPLLTEACQSCEALGICGGGCPMNAERTTGSLDGLDARFCVHAKNTLQWLVWDVYRTTHARHAAASKG